MSNNTATAQPQIGAVSALIINPLFTSGTATGAVPQPANNPLLDAALFYAARGWRILPLHGVVAGRCTCGDSSCNSPGKRPYTKNGVKDATTDPNQIRLWWHRWPVANVGIATGVASGVIVVDLDNTPQKPGENNLIALAMKHSRAMPNTLTALTGRGKHLYFRAPDNGSIRNRVNIAGGIDVRSDEGYVVAAPSGHVNGNVYRWQDENVPVADLPDWLLQLLTQENKQCASKKNAANTGNDVIPEGTRNDTLYRIGCALRGQTGMGEEEIRTVLLSHNRTKCVPPLPESEVLTIVESVLKYPAESGPKKSLKRQAASPLYWFPFNCREFLADQRVALMEDYQVGWHINLLVSAYMNGGYLPTDLKHLRKIARAKSKQKFEQESDLILDIYEEVEMGGVKKLRHPQLSDQYAETLDNWMKKKEAGEERVRKAALAAQQKTGADQEASG